MEWRARAVLWGPDSSPITISEATSQNENRLVSRICWITSNRFAPGHFPKMLHFPSRRKLNGADPPASGDRQSAPRARTGLCLNLYRANFGWRVVSAHLAFVTC